VPSRKLAIVGGGAKAAAICAKAAVLRELAGLDIGVSVFERSALGAAWDGKHGFTDGEQRLCTPAERDIGYPYSQASFGPQIASAMQARFSWPAFAVLTGEYGEWIDKGRRRLPHARFAAYVDHCIRTSGATPLFGNVTRLQPQRSTWEIEYQDRDTSTPIRLDGFDAVVVTSTGPAKAKLPKPNDPRVLDGVTFWTAAPSVPGLAQSSDEPIVIVGSGGTAAAIAAKLARMDVGRQIVILGTQPTLYARIDSFFENQMFRDAETWASLSSGDRRAFTDRLTRGAVWANVLEDLADADLVYRPGEAKQVRNEPPSDPAGELLIEFTTTAERKVTRHQPASVVIDATGFDASWFADLLPPALRDEVRGDDTRMRKDMDPSLMLPLAGSPPLHAPMLSQVVGPAYTSLMALGSLSDAILKPYVAALT